MANGTLVQKIQCPKCLDSGQDNLAVYTDGAYCFSCGHTESGSEMLEPVIKEKKISPLLPQGKFVSIPSRRLTADTCRRFGHHVQNYTGSFNFGKINVIDHAVSVFDIIVGGVVVAQKIKTRTDDGERLVKWVGDVSQVGLIGEHACRPYDNAFLVITEGEEDAEAVIQVLGGDANVVSIPNGSSAAARDISKKIDFLQKFKYVILCFDQDEAGKRATEEVGKLLKPGQYRVAHLSEKDACEMLIKGKDKELRLSILTAETINPDTTVSGADIKKETLFSKLKPSVRLKYPLLNYHMRGFRPGELTIIAAGSGLGKTTFTTDLAIDLVTFADKRGMIIELETDYEAAVLRYISMYNGIEFGGLSENPQLLTDDMYTKTKDELLSKLVFCKHYGSIENKKLLNLVEYHLSTGKLDFIILDNLTMLYANNTGGEGERKNIDMLMQELSAFATRTGVHVIAVSHLSNPPKEGVPWKGGRPIRDLDLRGSGNLSNFAFNIIGIEGNLFEESIRTQRQIRLLKTRYGRTQEVVCDTYTFDPETSRLKVGTLEL